MATKKLGIYLHIPFCLRKCAYCDFCSVPYEEEQCSRYIQCVKKQMEDYRAQTAACVVDTVYLGGGTPTVPDVKYAAALLKCLKKTFRLDKQAEITAEANPAVDCKKKFKKLRALGVNRLSIGLQSAQDNELRALGRLHDRGQFEIAYGDAVKAKFENVNVDIMFGIPEQTLESFSQTLDFVLALSPRPRHISCYGLQIEEGTPFYEQRESLPLPDEDCEAEMYAMACRRLREAGYNHYEISNFAQSGYESHHNLKYWECEEYLGFGVAAASYYGNHRFTAVRDLQRYMEAMEAGESCMAEITDDPYHLVMGDYLMLNLRLAQGVSYARFLHRFQRSLKEFVGDKVARYVASGHMTDNGLAIAFTEKGFYLSNYILADLLNFKDE